MFCETIIHPICRKCGARLRVPAAGWVLSLLIVAIQLCWWVMGRRHLISNSVAIAFLLVTLGLYIWIFPILVPLRLHKRQDTKP